MLLYQPHAKLANMGGARLGIARNGIAPTNHLVTLDGDELRQITLHVRRNEFLHSLQRWRFQQREKYALSTNGIERITKRRRVTFSDLTDERHDFCRTMFVLRKQSCYANNGGRQIKAISLILSFFPNQPARRV